MTTSVKQMMEAANAVVQKITPAEARDMMAKGNTMIIDVRDAPGGGEERQDCSRRAPLAWNVRVSR
jgi:hypothetical protein